MIDWFIIASSWVSISQRRAPGLVDRQPAAVQEPRRRKSCPRRRLSGAVRVHGRRPALAPDHQLDEVTGRSHGTEGLRTPVQGEGPPPQERKSGREGKGVI